MKSCLLGIVLAAVLLPQAMPQAQARPSSTTQKPAKAPALKSVASPKKAIPKLFIGSWIGVQDPLPSQQPNGDQTVIDDQSITVTVAGFEVATIPVDRVNIEDSGQRLGITLERSEDSVNQNDPFARLNALNDVLAGKTAFGRTRVASITTSGDGLTLVIPELKGQFSGALMRMKAGEAIVYEKENGKDVPYLVLPGKVVIFARK